jgi:palmitoyltransferase ZDHHC13/17
MTTNERINSGRYKHFSQPASNSRGGHKHRSPFHKGILQNLVDFTGMRCCGLFKPDETDWLEQFEFQGKFDEAPLLDTKENYQYI